MIVLGLTIIPSIAILLYVIFSDKFREPLVSILTTFFLGFLIILPAGFLNSFLIFQNLEQDFLFVAGLTEESLKLFCLYFFIREKKHFNEPMDGIVYGVLISLGFATYENIQYVYFLSAEYGVTPFEVAVLRAFSAIPMHAICGIIMGYFFGEYVFKGGSSNLTKSWIIPVVFHGLYNFLVTSSGLYLIILFVAGAYSIRLIKNVAEKQKLKKNEDETKII